MKKIFCCLLFLILFFVCVHAQDEESFVTVSTQTVSINEDQNIDNETKNDEETYTESGAIVKTAEPETPYELNIPTTTALGISGEQVLNKLGINKSSQTAVNVSSITSNNIKNEIVTSSDSAKQKKNNTDNISSKKEAEKEDKTRKTKNQSDNIIDRIIPSKLPFNSQLLLSGRKLIGVNYNGTIYDKEESGKRSNTSSFSMEQELQMKIKGKVGDRLELNVDFDDTQEDKRDISIVYKGKPGEFVQEAAFGDISVN